MSPSLKNLVYEKYELVKFKNPRIFFFRAELKIVAG